MSDPEQDEVFDLYLKRRAVLPALDGKLEPPAAVDAAVLAKAREAIEPATGATGQRTDGISKVPSSRPARWAMPVALAAVILLCLSVLINVSVNTNRPRHSLNVQRAAAARADAKASALANATAEANAAGSSNPGAADDRFANNGEASHSISGEIASREVVLPRAKVAGAQAPRAPVEVESAAAPNAVSADAASPTASTSAPTSASASRAAPHPADPKVWLQRINALRAAGNGDQADAEMRRFKVAYPDYSLPAADLPK